VKEKYGRYIAETVTCWYF